MANETGATGAGPRMIGIILLLILLALIVWFLRAEDRVVETVPQDGAGEAPKGQIAAVAPETVTPAEPVPAAEPEASAETDQAPAPEPTPVPENAPATISPTFDVVRVDPGGNTVIAGRAAPGAHVDVLVDGKSVGGAEADATGGFVAILDLGTSEAPRAVGLSAGQDGAETASEQVVVLAPTPAAEQAGTGTAAETAAAEAEAEAAPEEVASAPKAEPETPSVILADQSGVRVLQGGEASPEVADNVVIDAITYNSKGEVALSGRAPGEGGNVRVYINNAPVETGSVGTGGQWRVDLPDVDTGTYTLRVDQVDAAGKVTSRAETPFQREAPEAIRQLAETQAQTAETPLVELVTVQPGNTLWGISQRTYGQGTLFVRLFEANKEKIRDPDLIYPGQIFSIPN